MKYKAIFFDLDGTVISPHFHISDKTKEAIHKLNQKGFRLGIATGRSFLSAKPYVDDLRYIEAGVFSNGAVIEHPHTKERELVGVIEAEDTRKLCSNLIKEGFTFKCQTADGVLYKHGDQIWPDDDRQGRKPITEEVMQKDALKMNILFGQAPSTEEKLWRVLLGAKAEGVRFFKSASYAMEITNKKVSKWEGIKEVLKIWGVEEQEVIAVGDHENDREMILHAGFGVSVEEGFDDNHKISKLRIPAPDKGGIDFFANYVLTHF